ncbi:MAG: hypothetical protein BZY79_02670 [SAR202 cluster bacterium Casp-Chloro-G4]|nr:lysylphosphatidylglycerol synthase transmembrane domain-containing protein [Chloroflexota bacterium]MDA1227457.1 lysylphosphatidylglycerol synthase transmembrane domain-containing protein [Chloroflexota bacterium]PKB61639.1 MAG: hypothetical protein BZY79_02670 [SAR202 cluster bacterium Casp-Chloro-G4]
MSLPSLLSFAVVAVLLIFLMSRFSLDWEATWASIRSINIWMYLAAIGMYFASFWFRGMRWQLLARNTGALTSDEGKVPSTFLSAQFILIGWFVNSVMWLRLGDAYRAYLFAHESKGSFSWSLGTILAERIADIATILVVLVISIAALTITHEDKTARLLLLAALAGLGISLVLLLAMRYYGQRLAQLLPKRFETAYTRFQQGTLGSFKQLPAVFLLGLIGWALEIGRLYFVVAALGVDAPLALIPIAAAGHAILSAVPTPGGLGVVEPGIIGLLLISLERSEAVSIVLVDRSITYLSVIALGGLLFLIMHITSKKRNRLSESPIGPI